MSIESLWNFVLNNSLRASVLIGCVVLLRILFRGRLPAQCFHLLWLLVVIRLLVPIAPVSSWSVFNLFYRSQTPLIENGPQWQVHMESTAQPMERGSSPPAQMRAPSVEPRNWLAILWMSGMGVQILLFVISAWQMRRRLKEATISGDPRLLAMVIDCAARMGIRGKIRLLETTAVSGPAVVGMWRPRLLLPRGLADRLTDEELRFVLLHECAHLRRRDLQVLWLMTAARLVHWFNPCVWLAARLARTDAELACDETVLRHTEGNAPIVYGETLLKLAQVVVWRQSTVPSVGIVESKRAMRARLSRIASYTGRTPFRTFIALSLVVVVGLAFGADEKKESTPDSEAIVSEDKPTSNDSKELSFDSPVPSKVPTVEPAEPGKELPSWAAGWSIVELAIPSSGEIKDAYVTLKTPGGRDVTLTTGVRTKEGVSLDKIEWQGSPVSVKVFLRKGEESAGISVPATLVSKRDELKKKMPQIEIRAKFIEITERDPKAAKSPAVSTIRDLLSFGDGVGTTQSLLGVLTEPQYEVISKALQDGKGIDLLSAPKVTARSGQGAVVEVIREFKYTTGFEKDPISGASTPKVESRNLGVTLECEGTIGEDDTIDLNLTPQVVELVGFVDPKTLKSLTSVKSSELNPFKWDKTKSGPPGSLPIFSTRKVTTSVTIQSGATVVFGEIGEKGETKPFKSPNESRRLVVFVTALILPVAEKAR